MTVVIPSTADVAGGGSAATGRSGFDSRGCGGAGAGPTSGVAECEFAGAGLVGNGTLRSGGV